MPHFCGYCLIVCQVFNVSKLDDQHMDLDNCQICYTNLHDQIRRFDCGFEHFDMFIQNMVAR
jgi:Fe-S-cluster-containing dehydrogenase component